MKKRTVGIGRPAGICLSCGPQGRRLKNSRGTRGRWKVLIFRKGASAEASAEALEATVSLGAPQARWSPRRPHTGHCAPKRMHLGGLVPSWNHRGRKRTLLHLCFRPRQDPTEGLPWQRRAGPLARTGRRNGRASSSKTARVMKKRARRAQWGQGRARQDETRHDTGEHDPARRAGAVSRSGGDDRKTPR